MRIAANLILQYIFGFQRERVEVKFPQMLRSDFHDFQLKLELCYCFETWRYTDDNMTRMGTFGRDRNIHFMQHSHCFIERENPKYKKKSQLKHCSPDRADCLLALSCQWCYRSLLESWYNQGRHLTLKLVSLSALVSGYSWHNYCVGVGVILWWYYTIILILYLLT